MSKTIDAQIEKSELLIEGFRKHIENLREWGVEEADLGAMSERLKDLKVADEACMELRQELSKRVKAMNEIKNDISQMALDIAEKVVEKEIRPEDHKALIEEFIVSVGDDA